ncbi:hypothetical protein ACFL4T_09245 [candidate division KSB1 bacterium]
MNKRILILSGIIVFSLLLIFNCAGKKVEFWGSAKDGFNLTYRQDAGSKFLIDYSSHMEQTLDMMGNEQVTSVKSNAEYQVNTSAFDKEKGTDLDILYNKFTSEFESAGGTMSTDFSGVIGKKANLVLSFNGVTSGFKGFDVLPVIDLPTGEKNGEREYVFNIRYLFPLLPEIPVKFGDTWQSVQKIEIPLGSGGLNLTLNYTYKLIEETNIDGIECLRIEGTFKQTGEGEGDSPQGQFTIEGEGEGKDVLYFAYKKGMFLKYETNSVFEGNVGAAGMEFPLAFKISDKINITF